MPRIFLLAALRNLLRPLWRHPAQSLINIASLAIGLTVFGFAFLYVKQELSYDHGWSDGERVHRLVLEQRGVPGLPDGEYLTVVSRAWPSIVDYFAPQTEHITRMANWSARPADAVENFSYPLTFVDPAFKDIFELDIVQGDLGRVLSGPGYIALEVDYAARIGYAGGVGRRLTLVSGNQGAPVEYEVGAIFRMPRPSSVSFTQLTLIHEYSFPLLGESRRFGGWENSVAIWLKLKAGIETAAFNALQSAFIQQEVTVYNDALGPDRKISDHLFYRWQPLTEMHFNPVANEGASGRGAGDPARVVTFAIVGLLVLLVGCSNSVSLGLAAALERRREIGIRKAAGALQHEILQQQLGQSVLLALIALIPVISMLELLQGAFQALLPFTIRIDVGTTEYALMALIACVVGVASGFYPAVVLASTRPQVVLKAGAQESRRGGLSMRSLLVGVQFCFASMLLIGTTALYVQLAVTRAQPLGFDADNTIFVVMAGGQQQTNVSASALAAEFEKIPGVRWVMPAFNPPNANMPLTANRSPLVRNRSDLNEVQAFTIIGDRFTGATGMKLLAGRDFDPARDIIDPPAAATTGSAQPPELRTLINATAARELGFLTPEDAVEQSIFRRFVNNQDGKVLEMPLRIIGVIEDNLYASVRRRPGPEMYQSITSMNMTGFGNLMVKYDDVVAASIQDSIREVATRVAGRPPGTMLFIEAQLDAAFQQERNESKLLLICGGIALLLACIGLYGLAAFQMERRVKEVGVRKALGASSRAIVALFLLRFARPVVIANLLAWPAALYFVLQWIQRFPYQLERAWLLPLCIGTALAVLVISLLTVGFITARAANANPVRSLRYE